MSRLRYRALGLLAAAVTAAAPIHAQPAASDTVLAGGDLQWWRAHPSPDTWVSESQRIHQLLIERQKKRGIKSLVEDRDVVPWLLHVRWLKLFPPNWERDAFFSDEANRRAYVLLACEKDLPGLLLASLVPDDDAVQALKILCSIYRASPTQCRGYPALAVAHAVVFDQPVADFWPHQFTKEDLLPIGDLDPAKRFAFYVESFEQRRLLLDPRQLSVRELTFVVGTPVKIEELVYGQQQRVHSLGQLSRFYEVVPYDYSRKKSGAYLWPHGEYTLAQIARNGGICADRGYYVAITGKSKGVPTIFFNGQGQSGGHIWIGHLVQPGRWAFDIARYQVGNYPMGLAIDPQTWKRITDSQLRSLLEDRDHGRNWRRTNLLLQWAAMNSDQPFYRDVLILARQLLPGCVDAWELEAKYLDTDSIDLEERRSFWLAWIRNFQDETDLKVHGQRQLVTVYEKMGRSGDAEHVQRLILQENRSDRFDLAIGMAAEIVFQKVREDDWRGAEAEFNRALDRFRMKSGGHLFYTLVQPYVNACLQEGRTREAGNALKKLDSIFTPRRSSVLELDIRKLKTRAAQEKRR